jgi:hypothetical protein
MERGVWVLALIVSAGSKLVTLILFIAAILPFWLSCFAPRKRIIKGFFRIIPNYTPNRVRRAEVRSAYVHFPTFHGWLSLSS